MLLGGICAVKGNNAENIVKEMCRCLEHRGPDDEGEYAPSKNIALGHRALFIQESPRAHQPLSNEDETIWITFDGAIYNFEPLKRKLEKNHEFRSMSSAELVIHAYEEEGIDCLRKLNGDFAFCLWDSKKRLLFSARDKIGIKPLYYCNTGDSNRFLASSEIKALFVDPLVPRKPNKHKIYEYLLKGSQQHTGDTFFEGIQELLPAHYILVGQNDFRVRRYWSLQQSSRTNTMKEEKRVDYSARFLELFRDAVKIRIPIGSSVGVFLSGGIDSASLTCLLDRVLESDSSQIDNNLLELFSAVYPNTEADEKAYADEVARIVNGRMNYVHPSVSGQWADIKQFVYYMDEPTPVFNYYVYWCLCRVARSKVRVVLNGMGSDAILGVHDKKRFTYYKELWRTKKIVTLLAELIGTLPQHKIYNSFKDYDFKSLFGLSWEDKYKASIRQFFSPEFAAIIDPSELKDEDESSNVFLSSETFQSRLIELVQFLDRASSTFSIKSRYPFLDYRIVQFAFTLPTNQKIKNGLNKYILRNSMKGIIPEAIRKRRDKLGTPVPLEWLVNLEKEIRAIFESRKFRNRGYFNQPAILDMYDHFCKGKMNHFEKKMYADVFNVFWRILNLELWFEVFFDSQNEV
jgi:asparagine synthase (glutamine-hydrolysing)